MPGLLLSGNFIAKMSRILVTGSNGQLGHEFQLIAEAVGTDEFHFVDLDELDITDATATLTKVQELQPDVVINCAAYTAVDRAEEQPELAMAVNVQGVQNLVNACQKANSFFVHYSTDYVFDGKNHMPYNENDPVQPLGTYGKTKRLGEEAVLNSGISAVVIRTSWVYSSFGNNFVKTMMRLGKERDALSVVFDQVGTPTNARDLANATIQILDQADKLNGKTQLFHFSNEGVASWYDFALEVFHFADIDCKVTPILSEDYPTQAERPHYSILDKSKFKSVFGLEIPHWKSSLKTTVQELMHN